MSNQSHQKQVQCINQSNIQVNPSQIQPKRQTFVNNDQGVQVQSKFYSFQAIRQTKTNFVQQKPNHQPQQNQNINQTQVNDHQDQNKLLEQKNVQFQHEKEELKNIPTEDRQACQEISQQLLSKTYIEQLRKEIEQKITPLYKQFCKAYENLLKNIEIAESINTYAQILVKYWDQEMFFQHFVYYRYLNVLMLKIREFKYADEIVKAVFGCLEYLLKGLGDSSKKNYNQANSREEQFIYLLVMINKEGFIHENYKFSQSEDWAYYAHFMKLLIRIINQADKAQQLQLKKSLSIEQNQVSQAFTFLPQKISNEAQLSILKLKQNNLFSTYQTLYSKYLTLFFNQKIPQFPLLLKLLYFYKWPDGILQTSVKLCLLEISNHPNRRLQKYFLNFPFVTFYLLYCTKISDNVQKYLNLASLRPVSQRMSQKQEVLLQQIISDIKFMEDYLKIEEQEQKNQDPIQNYKINNIQQQLNMYINTFFYYIGRGFYQQLTKFISQQNARGVINGMLLIIKIMSMNTVIKIRIGFEEMFHKYINCDLFDFLRAKRDRLNTEKYWIFDQCEAMIREHAENILFVNHQTVEQQIEKNPNFSIRFSQQRNQYIKSQAVDVVQSSPSSSKISTSSPQPKAKKQSYSSLFKSMSSFIPATNSNWLYYEMKKISQVLGLEVSLNKEINHDPLVGKNSVYFKNSFLSIIDKIQQNHLNGNNSLVLKSKMSLISRFSSPIKINPLFSGIANFANKGVRVTSGKSLESDISSKRVYEDSSEQLIYYYIILLCYFKQSENKNIVANINRGESNINLQQICQLLKITKKCKSLMLVGIMYWYIKTVDYQLEQKNQDFLMPNQQRIPEINKLKPQESQTFKQKQNQKEQTLASELLDTYIQTISKLVYYALTEGWAAFIKHTKQVKKIIWNKHSESSTKYLDTNLNSLTQFSNDIFRDIECDIVYFIMLRHVFGTRNSSQELNEQIQNALQDKDTISKQIKVPCRLTNSQGEQVYLVMDGQYIKFITMDDILITKKPLTISSFNVFYQQRQPSSQDFEDKCMNENGQIQTEIKQKIVKKKEAVFQLVDIRKADSQFFTVYFQQTPIREYVAREIKQRKKIVMDIEMGLRSMRFDIED